MDRFIRYLVPVSGLLGVATLAALLILQVVWRPWSDINRSWQTHLNVRAMVPPDYTRTPVAYVGETGGMMGAWAPVPAVLDRRPTGWILYVARGCASCHGLEADGGPAAPPVAGVGARGVLAQVRAPLGRMPAYSIRDLSDQELQGIARYLGSLTAAPALARGPNGRDLYLAKGCGACHGPEAQGGPFAPAVADVGKARVFSKVRSPSGRMPAYSTTNLSDDELHEIARYLGGLERRQTAPKPGSGT